MMILNNIFLPSRTINIIRYVQVRIVLLCSLCAILTCTIQVKMSSHSKKSAYHFKDMLEGLEKYSIVSHQNLIGLPIEVTIVDDKNKPVPYAFLVLRFKEHCDTLETDSLGIVHLTITDSLLGQNPEVRAVKNDISYGTIARLFGEFDTEAKPVVININEFASITKNRMVVLYKLGAEAIAESILTHLNEQKSFIRSQLRLEPIPWGVILIDTPVPVILKQTHFEQDFIRYHLYPISTINIYQEFFVGNFRSLIKNTFLNAIQLSEPSAFWFFNGLADYWTYKYILTINKEERKSYGIFLYDNETNIRLQTFFKRKLVQPVNLLKWKPSDQTDWFFGFQLFLAFWKKIYDDYRYVAVQKFLFEAKQSKLRTSKELVKVLTKYTSDEVNGLLISFSPQLVQEKIKSIQQEVNIK